MAANLPSATCIEEIGLAANVAKPQSGCPHPRWVKFQSAPTVMQHAMSPEGVLAALDEEVTLLDGSSSNPEAAPLDEPRRAQ
jgi:hypothetical protein